jgi:hypothetical protein
MGLVEGSRRIKELEREAELAEARCQAMQTIWRELRMLYGKDGFKDFESFCEWLDNTFGESK